MIDRTEWLERRRKGIGGTDAPAILGLSRYRSAIDVWEDKLGLSAERAQTAPMRWGLALEDAIADAYQEETGRRVRRVGIRRAKHVRDFPMIGSIDRMTYLSTAPVRVVELKTSRSSDGWAGREEWPDLPPEKRVPADYYVQVQHYLEVVEADVADVAVLFSGSDFRVIEIPRDVDFGADLRAEESTFWNVNVLGEVQPEVTADDLDFLSRRYPVSADEEKVATPELAALVDEIVAIDDQVKDLERSRNERRAKVEEYLGTAAKLLTPRASVRWRSHDVTRTAWKEYAGVLESAFARIDLEGDVETVESVRRLLSRAVGTTDLGDVRSLYSTTKTERPFVVDRKKEGAK